ncbi:MAG: hypothetical protein ABGW69_02595, partial [Nanoarchaeota archaeon]
MSNDNCKNFIQSLNNYIKEIEKLKEDLVFYFELYEDYINYIKNAQNKKNTIDNIESLFEKIKKLNNYFNNNDKIKEFIENSKNCLLKDNSSIILFEDIIKSIIITSRELPQLVEVFHYISSILIEIKNKKMSSLNQNNLAQVLNEQTIKNFINKIKDLISRFITYLEQNGLLNDYFTKLNQRQPIDYSLYIKNSYFSAILSAYKSFIIYTLNVLEYYYKLYEQISNKLNKKEK